MSHSSSSLGQQSTVNQAEFPWALLCQQKPTVPFPGHSSVLPLELTSHSLLWLLEGWFPLAGGTCCFWQTSSALLPKQQ